MKNWLIETIAAIFSGCLVMIFHEFPKAFLTYRMDKKMYHKALFRFREIFRFKEYLDGLGLFFLIIGSAGFSRPYLIRFRERHSNLLVGLTGWIALIVSFFISIIVLRLGFHMDDSLIIITSQGMVVQFLNLLFFYLAVFSLGMFLTNLFPMSTNDMALVIAGVRPDRFLPLVKMDYMTKAVWLFLVLIRLIPTIGIRLITVLM